MAVVLRILGLVACLTVGALAWPRTQDQSQEPGQNLPNVLFLLTDDQRPDTIGALGNPLIHTPNLDRLTREGLTFTRAVTYYPLCVPSRAAILSGSTGFRNGVLPDYSSGFNPGIPLWPEVMRQAGYHTWYVGKWHSPGKPTTRGYDESRGLFASGRGQVDIPDTRDYRGAEITGYRGWAFQSDQGEVFPDKGVGLTPEISQHFADAAIDLIERDRRQPFFLHVNFTAPHDPLLIPESFADTYPPDAMPLPPNFRSQHLFDHGNFWGRDEVLLPWPRTPADVRRDLAAYYAVISHMDMQIGRIMEALERTGERDNTIVIFASDHGLAMGSHGLRGKQNMYEHTVSVPLIISGPGIPRNQRTQSQVYLRELFPTICDRIGLDVPEAVDGKSFAPVFQDASRQVHPEVFAMFRDTQRMVRSQDWKLIHYPGIQHYQLFHLAKDPHELNNLAEEEEHVSTFNELNRKLRKWQQEVGDPLLEQAADRTAGLRR